MKGKKLLFEVALTAVFSALCFALTFVRIPLPTGATVHLGNFACVLAGLLCGGVIGGLSGSIGMGLNDIASGYAWNTYVRTFAVKFILGFSVGMLFRILLKKKRITEILLYAMTAIFIASFILTLTYYIKGDPVTSDGIVTSGMKQFSVSIGSSTKTFKMSVLVPVFTGIFALVLLGVVAFLFVLRNKKKDNKDIYMAVATITALSVLINLASEFFLRWLINGILYGSDAAFMESVTKIPANLITGIVTILAVTIIYLPVYYALVHAGYEKYIIPSAAVEKETDEEEKEAIHA